MTLSEWSTPRLARLEDALATVFSDAWPDRLREACRYPLHGGGKRIRPLLCMAACEAVGAPWADALEGAVAIELVHTYSLVHDDLPCMDDDDERRGRPTVHRVYGEAVAVLVGDALLTEAFRLGWRHAADLAEAAGARGMIAGQALDIGLDGAIFDRTGLERLHAAKTGALIRAATRIGGRTGGATADALDRLDRYATALGLAFQVWDDVLDAEQDAAGPPSYVKLLGKEGAMVEARTLVHRAVGALAGLPGDTTALRLLARFTVDRAS